jgi:hypothetical protein
MDKQKITETGQTETLNVAKTRNHTEDEQKIGEYARK